jgi:uncharacterized protein YndB with AHSA1/START domain
MAKSEPPSADERETLTTRLIHWPRELVFKAWTDPQHLAKWWGPKGFSNTFHEFDASPGGNWRFVMHSPDGTDYPNQSVFVEVTRPERIVFDHLLPMHRFRVTATFDDQGGNTWLAFRMRFENVDECNKVKSFVIEANEQNLDRLEAELANMT